VKRLVIGGRRTLLSSIRKELSLLLSSGTRGIRQMTNSRKYEIQVLKPDDSLEEWDHFVDESPQGSIFCRSWWLRAVAPQRFSILTLRKGTRIIAGMPMVHTRKWGYHAIHMPPLTQTLGALLAPPSSDRYEKRLSREMDVLESLVEVIPKANYFRLNFHPNFTNWLPFYWARYEQTTRYSYAIIDLSDLDKVFSEFTHSKRKNIKKAQGLVEVRDDLPAADFYSNHKMTLRKQGEFISYSYQLFKKLYDTTYENHAGKTWYAIDSKGNIHAAIFVVFDCKSAYYLISSIDPDYRNSGASSLLLRDAIAYVSQYTNRFDFEGSMIKGVEHSFRKFGAIQTPYFTISKGGYPLLLRTYRRLPGKVKTAVRKFVMEKLPLT